MTGGSHEEERQEDVSEMKEGLFWKPLLVMAVACLLLVASGDKGVKTDGLGHSFSGFVTDSVSGTPIDSAKIYTSDTISGTPWYSDSTGYYIAASFRSRLTAIVQKTGYRTRSREVDLTGDPTDIDFELAQE